MGADAGGRIRSRLSLGAAAGELRVTGTIIFGASRPYSFDRSKRVSRYNREVENVLLKALNDSAHCESLDNVSPHDTYHGYW